SLVRVLPPILAAGDLCRQERPLLEYYQPPRLRHVVVSPFQVVRDERIERPRLGQVRCAPLQLGDRVGEVRVRLGNAVHLCDTPIDSRCRRTGLHCSDSRLAEIDPICRYISSASLENYLRGLVHNVASSSQFGTKGTLRAPPNSPILDWRSIGTWVASERRR